MTDYIDKGLFTNDIMRQKGGGQLKSVFMTRGVGGLGKKVTLHGKGENGEQAKSDFVWQDGFGDQTKGVFFFLKELQVEFFLFKDF